MERHEIEAWLGPAAEDLTDEQIGRLATAAGDIDGRYPDPDDADLREAALIAACQYLLGEITVEQAGTDLGRARMAEQRARAAAMQVAVMAVQDGAEKSPTARAGAIDRMRLLEELGERPRRRVVKTP